MVILAVYYYILLAVVSLCPGYVNTGSNEHNSYYL